MQAIYFYEPLDSLGKLECCSRLTGIYPTGFILTDLNNYTQCAPFWKNNVTTSEHSKWSFHLQENRGNCECDHVEE